MLSCVVPVSATTLALMLAGRAPHMAAFPVSTRCWREEARPPATPHEAGTVEVSWLWARLRVEPAAHEGPYEEGRVPVSELEAAGGEGNKTR